MSKERLSRLQRTILEELYAHKIGIGKNDDAWIGHMGIITFVGEKMGKVSYHPIFGRSVWGAFQSTFSQSLRSLADKGMVEIMFHGGGYNYRPKINGVRITDRGESALNPTNKLGIRRKVEAMVARAEKKFAAWAKAKET